MDEQFKRHVDVVCNETMDDWSKSSTWGSLLVDLIWAAATYWEAMDPQDFYVHEVLDNGVIFGVTNRIVWTPADGFMPITNYCSPSFLNNWALIGPLPRKVG